MDSSVAAGAVLPAGERRAAWAELEESVGWEAGLPEDWVDGVAAAEATAAKKGVVVAEGLEMETGKAERVLEEAEMKAVQTAEKTEGVADAPGPDFRVADLVPAGLGSEGEAGLARVSVDLEVAVVRARVTGAVSTAEAVA